jgi:hypothetical protein
MSTPHYLPTENLRVALVELRRPFTPAAIKFKVQSAQRTTPATATNDYAMVVAYVDARLVIERLNAVVGENWSDEMTCDQIPLAGAATCALTVLGVTRSDVGEATGLAQAKALRSDALKRAAVKFGVGVSVYASPRIVLKPGDGLRPTTVGREKKPSWALTQKAEGRCRKRYAEWLKKFGAKAFGEPLDHGDVEASQGDWEIEEPTADADRGPIIDTPATLTDGAAKLMVSRSLQIGAQERYDLADELRGLDEQAIAMLCIAANVNSVPDLTQATLPAFREALAAHMAAR